MTNLIVISFMELVSDFVWNSWEILKAILSLIK